MKQKLIVLSLLLALAGCSAEPEPAKEELIKVDGERVTLTEPDKADFLKLAKRPRRQLNAAISPHACHPL